LAKEENIEPLFLFADYNLDFTIYTDETETEVADVSQMGLNWMVKKSKSNSDAAALLMKAPSFGIEFIGVFNPDPALNTLVVRVYLQAAETQFLRPGTRYHELKRMDPGLETVLSYGTLPFVLGVHKS
jgi:hypothetical protein